MYPESIHTNLSRPHAPWNQNGPQGQYYKGNNPGQARWQQRSTNTFQNEDFKFWCETCDKGFRFANHLENHKLQHQKCNIDGCQYVAHPKVITRHIQMQHSSGLFNKISKLNNPEEITKWREERRMKYPTKENIEKKKAEINERIKRGEKMGLRHEKGKKRSDTKDFANKRKQNVAGPKVNGKKRKCKFDVTKQHEQNKKICKEMPPTEEKRTLKPFAGIRLLYEDEQEEITEVTTNSLIEDVDEFVEKIVENKEKKTEPTICGALTSLMCQYCSSDEEEFIEHNTKLISNHNIESSSTTMVDNNSDSKLNGNTKLNMDRNNPNETFTNKEKVLESDNDSGPEEMSIVKNENSTVPIQTKTKSKAKNKKNNLPKTNQSRHMNSVQKKRKLPSTLLEKLLHKEIHNERNIVLQCIRHIVDNNFFDNEK
ncbi:hypothetical protein KGM_215811 [Danaus plexippus plexippus]|uniref:Uncharacterized protein n=1 Tax=Danaus plexippus plexippus TaxID=278856 RepID=A0A212FBE5_DANPL|nr:hypothetical protein KGM_215811 [Danaus plexippus plexippus]